MNKYNTEDYFSVIEKKTGRKIVDCGEERDALEMVAFDPANRTYTRNKFLMGPVIDVEMPKALPTNEIVQGSVGSQKIEQSNDSNGLGPLPQIKLPERQQEPFVV
ncbi:MAG: hypothetical protein EB127_14280 [Alphaproteobacteria bacterium]|nr:hypothetical protein [Alphaproteobacteria bacterium]